MMLSQKRIVTLLTQLSGKQAYRLRILSNCYACKERIKHVYLMCMHDNVPRTNSMHFKKKNMSNIVCLCNNLSTI
jgi:hypothetical protein